MAPIPRADLDGDNPSSDIGDSQDSPLRRQFSEPFRPQSTSTQISQSPEPLPRRLKCDWCGKLLMLPNDADISEEDILNDHINEAHPKSISFSGYDGADDTYDENGDLQDDDAIEQDEPIAQAAKPEDVEAQDEEGEDIAVEMTTDDNNGTQPTDIPVNVSYMPETKRDLLDWLSNPRTGYPEEYRLRDARWRRPDVKKRLERFWKVNDTNKFSPNYDQEAAKCESAWDNAFHDPSKSRKRDAPEPAPHPLPYKKPKVDKGQFLEVQVQEMDDLVSMLRTPEKYTPEELYVLTQTAAFALKTFQDEYLALDDLYLKAHRHKRDEPSYQAKRHSMQGHKKKGGAPLARLNEDKLDFEDKKEAMLYGYKHNYFPGNTPLVPIRTLQDPFVQGGFVPTPAQARKMLAKSKESGDLNPDGWATMKKHGLEYHAQMYEPRREPLVPKVTRKRKAAEIEVPIKTTDTEETQNESADADETDEDNHPAKRRTRGRGGKTVVAESTHSDTNSRRGPGPSRGRGRGRGRGIGRLGSSRATFEVTPAPTQPSSRGRGRRGASSLASSSIPPAETSFPAVEPTATASPVDSTPASAKKEALSAEAIEEARRQKIANSKNPKRTKAMLDHWDRFNREGRIRNPKRSKAQIEQDRTVDGAADEVPKPTGHGRRKRSPSLAPLAGNLAPKGPTGLPSMANVQAQQQQPMAPTLPPMGVVPHYGPGPVNPFAAAAAAPMAQLGQPMPPQYAPFPYVQYHGMGPLPGHNPRDPRH
ncbi:uncharacterized protein N7479_004171 [Penicillium vulpinum]|uniref:Uncharacterized protein n=1 Tax=Penicillium vulpinum TaxID=29845 RepID=A0A1V6SBU4_9EURO|nr:uncharacterized protein N7479_004171 [Penicillium vulpinum]KAJ5964295.1 hypothetical protein N7479_004171 [Penicillium vulpinum]OQE11467.1 hypothetical protein PENVUL_c002G09846 [Penicillium vulpinum]